MMHIFRHKFIRLIDFLSICSGFDYTLLIQQFPPLVKLPMTPMGLKCPENNMAAAYKFQAKHQAHKVVEVVELAEVAEPPEAAQGNEIISILHWLRPRNASDLSRKRKLVVNIGGN